MDKSKKILIRVTEAERAILKKAARADGRSMAGLIRFAAREYAARVLSSKGLPAAMPEIDDESEHQPD